MRDRMLQWLREQKTRFEPWHDLRYALSFEIVAGLEPKRILDMGGDSIFTLGLKELLPDCEVRTTGDEELRTYNTDQRYDLVLLLEVIEHIHDLPTTSHQDRAQWTGSGQKRVVHQAANFLSSGGSLFMTTPNAAGLKPLANILAHDSAMTYKPHVRELTVGEMLRLVQSTGLRVVWCRTHTVWEHHGLHKQKVEEMIRVLENTGSSVKDRGDDIFLLARKV